MKGSFRDTEVEEALRGEEHAGRLESEFGAELYGELRDLARQADRRSVRGGPRVLILPGIMGSTLGRRRKLVDEVVWIDPIRIAGGKLVDLALDSGRSKYEALGVILLAYLKLKLRLKIAGFDADFYPYDWRQSLDTLGAELGRRLSAERAPEVSLVAHSMGGLVARAAVAAQAPKIRRVILLGTPNYGSFAPVQAVRGSYPVVRKLAALDLKHSAEELAEKVFSGLPGLIQMLPSSQKFRAIDLYQEASWPSSGPRPRQKILDRAGQVKLAEADQRFFLIAGVNEETVTGLRAEGGEFVYTTSSDGDGTVPLEFAKLAGVATYYVEESHGSLPNNCRVAQAVSDLLASGRTAVLAEEWSPARRATPRLIRDSELRARDLGRSDPLHLLEELVSPDAREPSPGSGPAAPARLRKVVVGRRRQHRIDVNLALGSIADVDARAYVLGIYRDVAPSGPVRELDQKLDGAIREFTRRRMFSGNVGEMFMMPAGRHALRADWILFAGLGPFDRFDGEVQQLAAEQVIRTLVRTNVEEFATVLSGAGSGRSAGESLQNLLAGFVRGLLNADRYYKFRSITLCEIDAVRYEEMKREIYRLLGTPLFEDLEVTVDEILLPPPAIRTPMDGAEPAYLLVRQEGDALRSSVLGAGEKATVVTGAKAVRPAKVDQLLAELPTPALEKFGDRLAEAVLPEEVVAALATVRDRRLVVVHDAATSRVPWETIRIDQDFPAAQAGLSRQYAAEHLSIAKWLEQRQRHAVLDILLVINPTENLAGAEREGERIRRLLGGQRSIRVEELRGAAATRAALLAGFRSGRYDVVHYAGHASMSGLVCHGEEVLSGSDLAGIGNLPGLVFFNACEAGRVRDRIQPSVGLAEAFLRGGVANYVGTYWPVEDRSAEAFATTFYDALVEGRSIGQALAAGRATVKNEIGSADWADYLHYGAPDFVLKER